MNHSQVKNALALETKQLLQPLVQNALARIYLRLSHVRVPWVRIDEREEIVSTTPVNAYGHHRPVRDWHGDLGEGMLEYLVDEGYLCVSSSPGCPRVFDMTATGMALAQAHPLFIAYHMAQERDE